MSARAWPHHELGKELSNWGRWGDDDEVGTLNFVTPGKRVQAAGLVRTGKVFDLGIPFDAAGKKWVRFSVWDSAGNGAFTQPVHLK